MKTLDLRPQTSGVRCRTLSLFALSWFAVVLLAPLTGLASKAIAQATEGNVTFDACFVKGVRIPSVGIKYSVIVQLTVAHPAFANPASTATLKVSDSASPPIIIFDGSLLRNGPTFHGGTSTPIGGVPTIIDPTFPLVVEVRVNNELLMLSGGSRARVVPASIDSPFSDGGTDWVKITGGGYVNDLGIKTPFKQSSNTNKTGDFVEEFRVTDWVSGMSNKPYRVKTFQGTRTEPIVDRLY